MESLVDKKRKLQFVSKYSSYELIHNGNDDPIFQTFFLFLMLCLPGYDYIHMCIK